MEIKKTNLLLYCLIIILAVVSLFGGIYLVKNKGYVTKNNTLTQNTTSSVSIDTSSDTSANTQSISNSSVNSDIDSELKTLDGSINSLPSNNLSDDSLSDSQVGL